MKTLGAMVLMGILIVVIFIGCKADKRPPINEENVEKYINQGPEGLNEEVTRETNSEIHPIANFAF